MVVSPFGLASAFAQAPEDRGEAALQGRFQLDPVDFTQTLSF
jgi:hypothetical protein